MWKIPRKKTNRPETSHEPPGEEGNGRRKSDRITWETDSQSSLLEGRLSTRLNERRNRFEEVAFYNGQKRDPLDIFWINWACLLLPPPPEQFSLPDCSRDFQFSAGFSPPSRPAGLRDENCCLPSVGSNKFCADLDSLFNHVFAIICLKKCFRTPAAA